MRIVNYNTDEFSFRVLVSDYLRVISLEDIRSNQGVFRRENDQDTSYHKRFYELARQGVFQSLYFKFIMEVVRPLYDESIIFQTIPTFRISFPNNVAVGEWHKDKDYRDKEWAEAVQEDNFFLPLTDAFDTNTIWSESEEDKGDFAPINAKYGQLIRWDGSSLRHGNKINATGQTRVSADFRVMTRSNYIPSDKSSINTSIKFQLDGYYTDINQIV